MVRLSDIMKTKSAMQPPAPSVPLTQPPVDEPPQKSSGLPHPRMSGGESQALYDELLSSIQRLLDDASQEQALTLGVIPGLTERLIGRALHDDLELFRLSLAGDGFSLARHGLNVAILAVQVGIEYDLKGPHLFDLALASILHDIGMVKVSHLIHVPGHLGPAQLAQVHAHPLIGHQLLQRCADVQPVVREIVLQEHERDDGSGYPHHLRGDRVMDHAQLVGLVDCYEALIHDRPYRNRLVPSEAIRTIVQDHRTGFRKELLRAFLKAIPIYPVGSVVELMSGERARVIATSRSEPLCPVVTILTDPHGQVRAYPETIDLSKDKRFSIARAVPEPVFTPPHGSPACQGGEERRIVPKGVSQRPWPSGRGAGFTTS